MINTLARPLQQEKQFMIQTRKWTAEEYELIVQELLSYGCIYLKGREEYTLFKEILTSEESTQPSKLSTFEYLKTCKKPSKIKGFESGVSSALCSAIGRSYTTPKEGGYTKPFLAPLDVQKAGSIAETIPSFGAIQSDSMSLNIGFDSEFQNTNDGTKNRFVLSLQMSIAIGSTLIRYFFLVDPRYQDVSSSGGMIPLKYCLADILDDLKTSHFPDFPLVMRRNLIYKVFPGKSQKASSVVDFKKMKDYVIPITLICHTGKADISVFRRSKFDVDIIRKLGEIQGGWMSTENIYMKAENDFRYNWYWLINLSIRDTLGLTPAENKSLKILGNLIGRPKIDLPPHMIEYMAFFAISNPYHYYQYAMNDADIVVSFCSEIFRCNHAIPMTLSSAAASAVRGKIKEYFHVKKNSDYDRTFRGIELLDDGLIAKREEDSMKFLKSTRYIPIQDNPDAKIILSYFEEAYTGGFNASFYLGWITEATTDFDLQNAYPTAMASIIDIDWSKPVRDFPRNYDLSLQDLPNPLIPAVAVGDFDFPDTCYCPNIPVPVPGGMKIYPLHGRSVYMSGPDMYLALRLGARIRIFRGFTCMMRFNEDGTASQSLAYAVSSLVQDRARAKELYKLNPLIEKSLKSMVCSCYGKTAQNVSPKTRYNAKLMGRVDSEPSSITSPYHATYTTTLVRCMLIGCVNQLQSMGYRVYSVTTDGFITNAPTDVIRSLDAYGFGPIFQNGRYNLNHTREACEANQVWEPKHFNDTFLNITTRGNVAVNDEGVLAHNSYTTGEIKDSRADRDAYIIAVLSREGRLKCRTKVWTEFSEIVERKHDFQVTEIIRQISMNFDYKRCPLTESAVDTPVHYQSVDGLYSIDTVIAEYDTRPHRDTEEFMNYRSSVKTETCVKTKEDLQRVEVKSSADVTCHIGKDLKRKQLLSILMGYRAGIYDIPALDGLKQSQVVELVNSWNISPITINDWKNCSRSNLQKNMLPRKTIDKMLTKILEISDPKKSGSAS